MICMGSISGEESNKQFGKLVAIHFNLAFQKTVLFHTITDHSWFEINKSLSPHKSLRLQPLNFFSLLAESNPPREAGDGMGIYF